ncbi:MAG: nicotinate phosphoribosyltransferase [Alphaproteobacteria bacterium]|nr:nicotinate phosphoribosyltransferase [Alphaproteobacteria bacterium]
MMNAILRNPLLLTDSYKFSHFCQYPAGTTQLTSYVEARAGAAHGQVRWFGLQGLIKHRLLERLTRDHVAETAEIAAAHGEPFNREGFERIVAVHGGRWPVRIQAAPEGMIVPAGNVLAQVTTSDPALPWVGSFLETLLLQVWYPTTVCTLSHAVRESIRARLARTADAAAAEQHLPFSLHDFGCRGASSMESAAIGGAAHLVNFLGTDTVPALAWLRAYYGEAMAGFSIPAAEHSTITAWGKDGEEAAYRNMVRQFAGPGKRTPLGIVAVVSDSYDLARAVGELWGRKLKQDVIESGGRIVVRPDSGSPAEVVVATLRQLAGAFGSSVNGKGYHVLHPAVRVVQGDGMTERTIPVVLDAVAAAGFSAENVVFGMGGGLLQQVNRDTERFAMKASAAVVEGAAREISKQPLTDMTKASKAGRLALVRDDRGALATVPESSLAGRANLLRDVYADGDLVLDETLAAIRARS